MVPPNLCALILDSSTTRRINRILGRVQVDQYPMYQAPSVSADLVAELKMDSLHEITSITQGKDDVSANKTWYQLNGKGYAHSRYIQPVRIQINPPAYFIPPGGCLGEITMPYVDAYSSVHADRQRLHRFYYASTFWVTDLVLDDADSAWYGLLDDRIHRTYYVPAYALRLVPRTELTPLSLGIPYEEKKLVVDLEKQTLTAYAEGQVVTVLRVSTGVRMSEGGFATPKGTYRTTRKRSCRHYAPPSELGTGFDLHGVPWVSYFTADRVGFHGTYSHNDFGVPHSHGCVNLSPQAAKWVYRWTTPTVPPNQYFYADDRGTRVIVQ